MKSGFLFFVLSLLWPYALSESCTTPLGSTSECISLYSCPQLMAALEQRPLQSHIVSFLKRSQCGFEGYTPRVCCGPLPSQPVVTSTTEVTSLQSTSRPTWPSSETDVQDPVYDEDSSPAPQNQCGEDNQDRIYGGQITDIDEFPWMALLGYRKRDGSLTYQCGGVLINRRYVLTAAHCVTGSIETAVGRLATVRLGEYDTQQDIDCLSDVCADRPQEIPVDRGYAHTGFSDRNKNRKDDIAIVRLARRANYSFYVKPICLVDSSARLDAGHSVYVAGWGKTLNGKNSPVKLKLLIPVFNKNECDNKFRPLGADLSDKQICAGGGRNQDTCRGDSGGPLMRRRPEGIWEAVGVVSFGNGCGREGWPGVYTSVASYDDWLRSKMRSTNV